MSQSRTGNDTGTCREMEEKSPTLEEKLGKYKTENEKLKNEKQSLLSRLSQLAGVQMTENNPNVTDLSDINRPINLGEDFSEIYDNEYTDVLVYLKRKSDDVKNMQDKLLKTAEICHKFCEDFEKKQFKEILGVFHLPDDRQSLPKGVIKHVKDLRTSLLHKTEGDLEKEFFQNLTPHQMQNSLLACDDDSVKKYISKCLSFFWRACIQTPPLYFDFNVKPGTPFDNAVHRKCTVNGPMVTYTVWPVAYLHKKGPLLVKGVVQCEKQEKTPVEGVKPKESKDGVNLHTGQTSSPGKAVQVININTCNRGAEPTKEKTVEKSLASKPESASGEKKRQQSHDQQ